MKLGLTIAWEMSARMVRLVSQNRLATLVVVMQGLVDSCVRLTSMNVLLTRVNMGSALMASTSTCVAVMLVTPVRTAQLTSMTVRLGEYFVFVQSEGISYNSEKRVRHANHKNLYFLGSITFWCDLWCESLSHSISCLFPVVVEDTIRHSLLCVE